MGIKIHQDRLTFVCNWQSYKLRLRATLFHPSLHSCKSWLITDIAMITWRWHSPPVNFPAAQSMSHAPVDTFSTHFNHGSTEHRSFLLLYDDDDDDDCMTLVDKKHDSRVTILPAETLRIVCHQQSQDIVGQVGGFWNRYTDVFLNFSFLKGFGCMESHLYWLDKWLNT